MKAAAHLVIEPCTLQPGQEWLESDTACAWHFLHITRGAAYWLGSERSRSLTEGEMLVIAPAAKGILRASQIGPVTFHAFHFSPDLLSGFFTLAERQFLETRAGGMIEDVRFLPSTHPVTQRFALLIQESAEPGSMAQRIEVLGLAAAAFGQEMPRRHAPAPPGNTALRRFAQFIAQMPEAEIINHTPDQLARLCGCSPRHFNRLFRKQFGASARDRQTELRLLKARQLLRDTNARIAQVALDSGYRNLGLFNALFKRRFGMTPSAWRRNASGKNGGARGAIAGVVLLCLSCAAALNHDTAVQSHTFRTSGNPSSHRIDTSSLPVSARAAILGPRT